MGEILLLRHGETAWSRGGRHTGRTDVPLTPRGEAQARALVPVLAMRQFALVLTSPLARAVRTAALAGLLDARLEPGLAEWDYGGYEGVTTAEIVARRPDFNLWRDGVPAGDAHHPGESVEAVGARADPVLGRARRALGDGDIALVGHGHALRVAAARWIGLPARAGGLFTLGPAARCVLGLEHDREVIVQWNLENPLPPESDERGAHVPDPAPTGR